MHHLLVGEAIRDFQGVGYELQTRTRIHTPSVSGLSRKELYTIVAEPDMHDTHPIKIALKSAVSKRQ